jgi:hypothetical protein
MTDDYTPIARTVIGGKTDPEDVEAPEIDDLDIVEWDDQRFPAPDAVDAPNANGQGGTDRDGPRLFRRWTMPELRGASHNFEWLARGLIAKPTHGMLAGARKTLKTYISQFILIAYTAGVPVFGKFEITEPRPAVAYVGEGGRDPYWRRLERIAASMGVELDDIPLFPSFEVAPVDSEIFQKSVERDLAEIQPGLFSLDPWYGFHGASDPRNLHDEGSALAKLTAPITDAGASLFVVNHFNQTGTGRDLDRITMAGGGEWSDSWWLVSHREEPDVLNGRFRLLLDVGSRQWGGSSWALDLNVGRFNIDAGEFDGDITYAIAPHIVAAGEANAEEAVIDTLVDEHWQHTKTQLVKIVGGNATEARPAINRLEHQKRIDHALVAQPEGEGAHRRMVKRDRYAMTNEPLPEEQPTT